MNTNRNNNMSTNTNSNTNMISNKNYVPIPTETLLQIFSYLSNDYNSLYNCLLVNKFWHGNVIGILYSNPFNSLRSKINNNTLQRRMNNNDLVSNTLNNLIIRTVEVRIVKLIDLYIKCLQYSKDFEEIEIRLNEKGIYYHYDDNNNNGNRPDFNVQIIPLLLDYSSYLRYLRYDDLFNFVSIYLNPFSCNTTIPIGNNIKKSLYTNNPYSIITKRTIVIELFKKFLYQRRNLIELSVNTNFINDLKKYEMKYFNGIDQDLLDIFKGQIIIKEEEIDKISDNTRTLICGGIRFDEILKSLQNNLNLTLIENFIIDFNSAFNHSNNFNSTNKYYISSDKIVEFLSSQKRLKKFCVIGRYYELHDIFFKLSLSQQNVLERLTSLEFYGIIFNNILTGSFNSIYQDNNPSNNGNTKERLLMNGIVGCHNLQELVFEDCVNITSETLYQLRNSKFTSLKSFTFRNCSGKNINVLSSHNSLATLIRNAKGILEEIRFGRKLKWCIRTIYDVYSIILEEMMNCERLKVVECCVLVDIVEEFLEMIQTCKTLEKVIVSVDCELNDNELFWKRFGRALNENRHALNELSICIGGGTGGNICENVFWIETFEWFFNSCDIPINILKFPMCYSINDNYLEIIGRYAKRVGGVKKVMLCENFIRRENMGGLKIEGVKRVQVCCDDTEFGDDDLARRFRFRNSIQ